MKQAFKTAYERELVLLKERAAAFAEEYPGLADRLGGLLEENLDPSIAGLLEGSAFLAARVQQNIDQQFRTFSGELLEQISPDMTAPLPAAMMVQGKPPGKAEDLIDGRLIDPGATIEAVFSEGSRRHNCRFQLTEPMEFWPVKIAEAEYHGTATPLSVLGCDGPGFEHEGDAVTSAGLVLTLATTLAKIPLADLKADVLPIHFTGSQREAAALYEQIFSQRLRVSLRWEDKMGTPIFRKLPPDAIEQVGFDHETPLFAQSDRLFPGVSTLLEYFAYPRKFLGFRIKNLSRHLSGIPTRDAKLIFEFDTAHEHLRTHFEPKSLQLFCAPAVNLFIEEAKPIALDRAKHRNLVAPNRTPANHFEVHRITSVRAQYEGSRDKVPVLPLYDLPQNGAAVSQALYFATERQRRALSPEERRMGGTRYRYEGTETWVTFYEPPEDEEAALLFVSTLCSNRHLPEILPISDGTFHLLQDRTVKFSCVTTPSAPRDAVAELEAEGPHRLRAGDNYWRLISLLSLSYRGFLGPDGTGNVEAFHEVMRLFSDISDQLSEAQITALSEVRARPITRTIERVDGFHPARGIEVRLIFDEDRIDSGTCILLGAALDRFLADYAAVNSFTETVIANRKGRELKRWPARSGSGPLL